MLTHVRICAHESPNEINLTLSKSFRFDHKKSYEYFIKAKTVKMYTFNVTDPINIDFNRRIQSV